MKKTNKKVVKQSVKTTAKVAKVVEVAKPEVSTIVRVGKTQMSVSRDGYKAAFRPAKNHILVTEKGKGGTHSSRRFAKASLGGAKKVDGVWGVRMTGNGGVDSLNLVFNSRKDALDFKKSFNDFFTRKIKSEKRD